MTEQDLKDYLATDKSVSFNEYIAFCNNEALVKAKKANPGKIIVSIADLTGETLEGLDLSKLDLSSVIFSKTKIRNCKFLGTDLTATCFEGSEMSNVNFDDSVAIDCNMMGVKGDNITFNRALMPRARMQCAKFTNLQMNETLLYSADLTDSSIEEAMLQKADLRRADLERVNMRSVDARYVKASMADLTGAIMNEVQAQFADFHKAVMKKVEAKGADFTESDFEEVMAQEADFEKSIMDRIRADKADFTEATLNEVKAREASFNKAIFEKAKLERADIRRAAIKRANFKAAQMSDAIMEEVLGYKTNFEHAIMNRVNLKFAELRACIFKDAKLRKAVIDWANFATADLEGADVTDIKFDKDKPPLVIDANLKDAIGAEGLKALQEEQHKIHEQFLGRSSYGYCRSNIDGTNDRFKCQRAGAAVLASVIGGARGYTLGGPLAGISTAALSAFLSDQFLELYKDTYHQDLGYINNIIGDRLAEIGAVALVSGAYSLDRGIDFSVAATICSSFGLVQGVTSTLAGLGVTAAGVVVLKDGVEQQSLGKKIVGGILTAVGAVTAAVGLTSMSASINNIVMAGCAGGFFGAAEGAVFAVKQLSAFNEEKGTGMRPEEIYNIAMDKYRDVWNKIVPTWAKLATGVVCGVALAVLASTVVAPLLSTLGIGSVLLKGSIAASAAVSGLLVGYIYENKMTSFVKDNALTSSVLNIFGIADSKPEKSVENVMQEKAKVKQEELVLNKQSNVQPQKQKEVLKENSSRPPEPSESWVKRTQQQKEQDKNVEKVKEGVLKNAKSQQI